MISVVISSFRRHSLLEESIKSILDQTYKDFELIIIFVHGDNKAEEVIDSFNDKRIKKVKANYACITYQKSLGFYSMGKSDYGMIFDSDDFLFKDSLKNLYNFAVSKKADVVYPDFYESDKNLKIKCRRTFGKHDPNRLLTKCYVTDVSFFKREVFGKYMPFKNEDRKNRFYRVWKQMSSDGCNIVNYPNPTFIYRQHLDNIHKKEKSQKDFIFVRVGNNNSIKNFYKNFDSRGVDEVDYNCFTIYFPNPSKYLKHSEKFKFKKIIIHWDKSHISQVDKFKDLENVYNITHDKDVWSIIKETGIHNVTFIKDEMDLLDYLKEERH